MNAKVQRVLCCLLALVLTVSLFSAIPAAAAEPATIASESRSGAVQVQQPANAQLIAATSYQLVPGVTETQVILNQKEKEAQVAGFLATIAPDADVPEQYRGIGIRIEDDIVITETGNENLTASVVKKPEEIEALMAAARKQ